MRKYQSLKSPVSLYSGFTLVGFEHVKDVDTGIDKTVEACGEEHFLLFWRFTGHDGNKGVIKGAESLAECFRRWYGIFFGDAEDNNVRFVLGSWMGRPASAENPFLRHRSCRVREA